MSGLACNARFNKLGIWVCVGVCVCVRHHGVPIPTQLLCKCRCQLLAAACCDAGFMLVSSQRMCTAGTG